MDGSNIDHNSDSDSGDSWTLLDHSPAGEVPELGVNPTCNGRDVVDTNERDEDTDGISIISDSDPESMAPCEISYEKLITNESRPTDQQNTQYISVNPLPSNNTDLHESVGSKQDFLGDHHGKHKTYVHRRNKRLSTVLNIIMLGSVITAAGVAIGHMWGAKHECAVHTTPSVNKILSNLYKLQEENSYLRNKLKELTLATNIQMLQRKASEKIPYKHRCKKVYEEPLNNKNADKAIKCLDNDRNADNILESHLVQPAYEKEFLHDMGRLKLAYQQNKSWLDDEVTRRLKNEEHSMRRMRNSLKSTNLIKIDEEQKEKSLNDLKTPESESNIESEVKTEPLVADLKTFGDNFTHTNDTSDKKISYADSLKSDQQGKSVRKREINEEPENNMKEVNKKTSKKFKKNDDIVFVNSASEEELKKDDRYVGRKSKQERKKHDRQKSHKKQKRKNKYDIWEIKGDMNDYDEFSVTSSQENDFILAKPDKNTLSRDFEKTHYINQFSGNMDESFENLDSVDFKGKPEKHKKNDKFNKKGDKNKELNWYEKRVVLRTEARKRLEQELFGETSPNDTAGWYFRRVQRREQCRAKGDNSTHRKLSKRSMNYKVKH